jgi:hypothetical protein
MKFDSLIKSYNWLSVKTTLLALYPEQIESINAYEEVFNKLQIMQPKEVAIDIILNQHYDDETFEPSCVDVSGINLNATEDDITDRLAIEFCPWNDWLGMGIDKLTLKEFTELEIIAHCLYEMTYAGYDENEIQEEFDKIKDIQEEYKNLTDEEKEMKTISMEELMKKHNIKDNEENES